MGPYGDQRREDAAWYPFSAELSLQVDRHLLESWAESTVVKGRWEVRKYPSSFECACYKYMHLLYLYICMPCTYMYMCIQMGHIHMACICTHIDFTVYGCEGKKKIRTHSTLFYVGKKKNKNKNNCINKIWEQRVLTKARIFVILKWKSSHRTDYLQIPTVYHRQDFNDSPSSICLHGDISTDTGCHGNLKQLIWACSLG